MSLLDKLRGEFIDIIEWTEPPHSEILAYRFPALRQRDQDGRQAHRPRGAGGGVRQRGPARRRLPARHVHARKRENMPILSTLKGWKYGFNSPFKAEVYFISTRAVDRPEVGHAEPHHAARPGVRPGPRPRLRHLRHAGQRPGRVPAPARRHRPVVRDLRDRQQLRNTIVARFVDAIGQAKMAVLDLAGNYDKIGQGGAGEASGPDLAADGPGAAAVLHREHLAAAGGGAGARQADADGRARQPRPVHEVPDRQRHPARRRPIPAASAGSVPAAAGRRRRADGAAARAGSLPARSRRRCRPRRLLHAPSTASSRARSTWRRWPPRCASGSLTRTTLVWQQGMAELDRRPEAYPSWPALFAAVPPPLPPA